MISRPARTLNWLQTSICVAAPSSPWDLTSLSKQAALPSLSHSLTSFSRHAVMAWTASNHPFLQNCRSRTRTHRPTVHQFGQPASRQPCQWPSQVFLPLGLPTFVFAPLFCGLLLIRICAGRKSREGRREGGERLSESLSLNTNFLPSSIGFFKFMTMMRLSVSPSVP